MRVRRIVDLSHPLETGMPVYPGDPEVAVTPAATVDRDGFHVLHVSMGSQSGTHVDAPYHFLADGARIDELDLAMFCGPAVVADVRHVGAREPIRWHYLAPVADQLAPGRLLLLHTGWSAHWGSTRYFDHPFLDAAAARQLADREVRTVGIDALSVDETVLEGDHPTGFAAHQVLLGAGGVIIENLTGLGSVDWAEPFVSALPIRLAGADGAPVRALALDLTTDDQGR